MTNKRPKVSIGIPVYNGEDYLEEAIRCNINQKFGDIEIIILDNASTDATPDIIRSFERRDGRIRSFRHFRNLGLTASFNMTLNLARGQYFSWAADDDLYAPTYVGRCVEALDRNPRAVAVHTEVRGIDRYGNVLPYDEKRRGFVADSSTENVRCYDAGRWIRGITDSDPAIRFETVLDNLGWGIGLMVYGMYRLSDLGTTRYRTYGMENLFTAETSLRGQIEYVKDPLFYYRMYDENQGVQSRKSLFETHLGYRPLLTPPIQTFMNYVSAVARADLTLRQRFRCVRSILRRATSRPILRRMLLPGPFNFWGLEYSRRERQRSRFARCGQHQKVTSDPSFGRGVNFRERDEYRNGHPISMR